MKALVGVLQGLSETFDENRYRALPHLQKHLLKSLKILRYLPILQYHTLLCQSSCPHRHTMSDSGENTTISTCLPLIRSFVETDRHRIILNQPKYSQYQVKIAGL